MLDQNLGADETGAPEYHGDDCKQVPNHGDKDRNPERNVING